jgi:hypothetical protein
MCQTRMSDHNSPTDDDVARLFRENDDLGADSSLWFRPLRVFLDRGTPPPPMTVLAFRSQHSTLLPFGVLTCTKRNRIVFWPVLAKNADMVAEQGKTGVIDHVTLELPSEKMHVTALDAAGKRLHFTARDGGHKQAWRLHRFEGTGLAFWFTLAVRWQTLQDQETAVQRRILAPTPAEVERRKQVFTNYPRRLTFVDVPLPPTESVPDYVYCVVYLLTDPAAEPKYSSDVFPFGDVGTWIDGWPCRGEYPIKTSKLHHEQTEFVVATACPPGHLRQEVLMGFPRRTPAK